MLLTIILGPALLLARAVAADGAAIVDAMNAILADTTTLGNTVAAYKEGDLLGVLPIAEQSGALLNAINNGTAVAQLSQPLSDIEAVTVAQTTQQLVTGVTSTLSTIEAAKPKFDKLLIVSPIVLMNLVSQKTASDEFSAAVIEKVPQALQATAQTLVAPIGTAFGKAISTYNGSP